MKPNSTFTIFKFTSSANITHWKVINDAVMGGKSEGNFKLNTNRNGEFYGFVSPENNGGFSSLKYEFKAIDVSTYKTIHIKIKGDGSNYQLRIKDSSSNPYSFITHFSTNKAWQTITFSLSNMYPSFRGKKLMFANFSSNKIEEIAFLIANKSSQTFHLEIDEIYLQ